MKTVRSLAVKLQNLALDIRAKKKDSSPTAELKGFNLPDDIAFLIFERIHPRNLHVLAQQAGRKSSFTQQIQRYFLAHETVFSVDCEEDLEKQIKDLSEWTRVRRLSIRSQCSSALDLQYLNRLMELIELRLDVKTLDLLSLGELRLPKLEVFELSEKTIQGMRSLEVRDSWLRSEWFPRLKAISIGRMDRKHSTVYNDLAFGDLERLHFIKMNDWQIPLKQLQKNKKLSHLKWVAPGPVHGRKVLHELNSKANLTDLSLRYVELSRMELDLIQHFTGLRNVELSSVGLKGEFVGHALASLKQLRSLHLTSDRKQNPEMANSLGISDLLPLQGHHELFDASFDLDHPDSEFLEFLRSFPTLSKLRLNLSEWKSLYDVENKTSLDQVRSLTLDLGQDGLFTDSDGQLLVQIFPHLQVLEIHAPQVSEGTFELISSLKKLEVLRVSDASRLTSLAADQLAENSVLREVEVPHAPSDAVKGLAKSRSIQRLYWETWVDFESSSLVSFCEMPNLQSLSIIAGFVYLEDGISPIKRCRAPLEKLTLISEALSSEDIQVLKDLPFLQELTLLRPHLSGTDDAPYSDIRLHRFLRLDGSEKSDRKIQPKRACAIQ